MTPQHMTPQHMTAELKQCAQELGFALSGACPAVTPTGFPELVRWLASGYAGGMDYIQDRLDAYRHPRGVLPGVRSLLMLGTAYRSVPRSPLGAQAGQVSCYAWGPEDYHAVIHRRLKTLCRRARELDPSVQVRGVVDTAPLLEREFAQLAGLGWVGKNTLLLNRQLGSWFFLAALLLDCELEYDEPFRADHCGSCTACLDACPTDAFAKPYVLDARRCISYLTIELRGPMDRPLRAKTGTWVFGCDICQDVCPWNRRAGEGDPAFEPRQDLDPLALAPLFALDDAAFRARFGQTPLWRARRRGLLRNAAIALGNQPNPAALPALITGLHDADPFVRGACAWALGQFTTAADDAVQALAARLDHEPDAAVRDEIRRTLEEAGG